MDGYIHSYIIDHYNPSVRITTYLLTPLMLFVLISRMSNATNNLMSTPNDRFIEKLSNFLFSPQSFQYKSAELPLLPAEETLFHISF